MHTLTTQLSINIGDDKGQNSLLGNMNEDFDTTGSQHEENQSYGQCWPQPLDALSDTVKIKIKLCTSGLPHLLLHHKVKEVIYP